jgi:DNA-binding response OmpR family regulator
MTQHKILVIGSNSRALFATSRILENGRYEVSVASNWGDGIETIKGRGYSLVLMESSLGDAAPRSVLQTIRNENPDAMVVMQSEKHDITSGESMFMLGADDYIFKPYGDEELLFRVRKNIEQYELKQKIKRRKNFYSSCCICKKIRIDDNGPGVDRWREIEDFLKEEMDVLLSSTYCPKCAQTVQEDLLVQIGRIKAFKVCR